MIDLLQPWVVPILTAIVFVLLALLIYVVTIRRDRVSNVSYVPVLQRARWYVPVIFASSVAAFGVFLIYKLTVWLLPASWKRMSRDQNSDAI